MNIFALDSSSRAGSAALLRDGVVIAESYADIGLTHSETLMELCNEVFSRAGVLPGEIDCFAASAGPGSFTGLRIGLGIIKGLAFPLGTPCVSVSSLEAAAYNFPGFPGTVIAAADARRNRVYCAAFNCASGAPTRLWDDGVLELAALGEKLLELRAPIMFVGDAASLCYDAFTSAQQNPASSNQNNAGLCYNGLQKQPLLFAAAANVRLPRAGAVALAALAKFQAGETVTPSALRPQYLQLPQAERERLAREQNNNL